jgi:glutamate N-acetyltransferase/amino-acid N-acetyltransferase
LLDDVLVVDNGGRAESYREADGQKVMDEAEFQLTVRLGRGTATEQLWTSDLSHEYVTINAEYRS